MQGTTIGTQGQSQNYQNLQETQQSNRWIQQNYGKTLGIIGALTAVGMIGYFIGKSGKDLLKNPETNLRT